MALTTNNKFVTLPKKDFVGSAAKQMQTGQQPASTGIGVSTPAKSMVPGAVQGTIDYAGLGAAPGQIVAAKKSSTGGGGKKAVNPYDAQVEAAKTAYDNAAGAMPGAYQSSWQAQIDSVLNGILNRERFSYNQDADPMYQQYRNSYVTQGRNAMRDTMGQAAALTGGYGSSYAQAAGQQAYQNHLQQLASTVQPQLYNMALNAYNAENEAANNRLAALQQQENAAYGRWSDAYDRALQERAFQYDVWQDAINRQKAWKG